MPSLRNAPKVFYAASTCSQTFNFSLLDGKSQKTDVIFYFPDPPSPSKTIEEIYKIVSNKTWVI